MNTEPPRNIVVLVVDRLHRGFLGAYGNSWIQTPNFDRLAADGFIFDRAVIDSPRPEQFYRSVWQGWHALAQTADAGRFRPLLIRRLADKGYATTLLSDEQWLAEHPAAGAFQRRELLLPELGPEENGIGESIDETHWARFFAAAVDAIAKEREPFCFWLHTGLLGQKWDAPLEFRDQYRDEDDPESDESAEVPDRELPENFDPDELLATVHAYAGQVSLLDACLGAFWDGLAGTAAAANTLLILTSPRGFPLGEHGRIGACADSLYSELTHVPLAVRLPDGRGAGDRTQALVQPADLHATILDWCRGPVAAATSPACGRSLLRIMAGEVETVRDRACTIGPTGERAIVTAAWSMRMAGTAGAREAAGGAVVGGQPAGVELFAKPDDWFDSNEVGDRCREIASEMEAAFIQFEQASQTADAAELSPLPADLVTGMD